MILLYGENAMAITIRLRDIEEEMVTSSAIDMTLECDKKVRIKESDVIHTLIRLYLPQLKASDVVKYRKQILGKDG